MSGKSGQLVISSFYDEGEDVVCVNGKVIVQNLLGSSDSLITRDSGSAIIKDAAKRFGKGFIENLYESFLGVDYIKQKTTLYGSVTCLYKILAVANLPDSPAENAVRIICKIFPYKPSKIDLLKTGDELIINLSPVEE